MEEIINLSLNDIEIGERRFSLQPEFKYFWRVKTRLPERLGQRCAVLVRGKMNSCLVMFEDGFRVVTSRNYVRKIK